MMMMMRILADDNRNILSMFSSFDESSSAVMHGHDLLMVMVDR